MRSFKKISELSPNEIKKIESSDVKWEKIEFEEFSFLYGKTTNGEEFIKPGSGPYEICRHCVEIGRNLSLLGFHNANYEMIFGFGPHCAGFNPAKIIKIKSSL